jgi:serine/threonine protein kinase
VDQPCLAHEGSLPQQKQMRLSQGLVIAGRYGLEERLGAGGLAEVWRARDTAIGKPVALKILTAPTHGTDLTVGFHKVRRAAGLSHPSIASIFDLCEHDGLPVIVSMLVTGRTLQQMVIDRQAMPLSRRLQLLEQLCSGLAHAHVSGVTHGNLKPANVMVDDSLGHLFIVDVGVEALVRVICGPGYDGPLGNPRYASPEAIRASGPIDHRSDIYQAGLVSYELLSYRPPVPVSADIATLVRSILDESPLSLQSLIPELDPEIDAIVFKALAKRPDDRYQDIATMGRDIARVRGRCT